MMDNKHPEILQLREMTERKLGHSLRTPNDFNKLTIMIRNCSGDTISLSTLKRLWGYVAYPHRPSLAVLSILARFNGYSDWDNFCKSIHKTHAPALPDESDFLTAGHLSAADIAEGERITLQWQPDKSCTLEKITGYRFRVTRAENIKLQSGDIVTCSDFCTGQAFYASEVEHDGERMGSYVGRRNSGGIKVIIRNVKD